MKKWKEHQYFNLGIMLLSVVTVSLVLLAIVLNLGAVGQLLKTVQRVPRSMGFLAKRPSLANSAAV